MKIVYKIKDKLHLTLFWYTYDSIRRMKQENNEYKRLWILYRLIRKVWQNIIPEAIYELLVNEDELKSESSWETIDEDLRYYSDRWGWNRLNKIILMYNELNNSRYYFMPPKLKEDD
jgi:hypothetical protein